MRGERLREIASLALLTSGFVLVAAMLTYRENVLAADVSAVENVCGAVGAFVAGALLHKFGFAAYLIAGALLVEGVRQFRTSVQPDEAGSRPWHARMPGLLLFVVVLAAELSDLFSGATRDIPDPGGEVGLALSRLMVHQAGFGLLGGRAILLFLLLSSFLVASGLLYARTAVQVAEWAATPRGSRGSSTLDDPPRARPKRRARPAPVEDEDEDDAGEVAESEWADESDEDGGGEEGGDEEDGSEDDEDWEDDASAELDDDALARWSQADDESDEGEELAEDEEGEDEEAEDEEAPLARAGVAAPGVRPDDTEESAEDDDAAWARWEEDEEGAGEDDGAELADDGDGEEDDDEDWDDDEEDEEDWDEDEEDEEEGEDDEEEEEDGEEEEEEDDDLEGSPPPAKARTNVVAAPEAAPSEESESPQVYSFPSLDLLRTPESHDTVDEERHTHEIAKKLTEVLASFKVDARVVGIQRGPTIKMYEVELAPGTKLGRLRSLEDDLAMNLAAQSVRIVAPIPNKSTAGIEIPNEERETVWLRELIESPRHRDGKHAIPFFLGKDTSGRPIVADLAAMPHLLVAGSTGAGKSVALNTMIMSVLYTRTPQQVQMILIDPKMVELSQFQNVPHLMCPVVTDMKRAAGILEWAVEKMEARYQLLHEVGVRNIQAYNKLGPERVRERLGEEFGDQIEGTLPYIVIVIDELADLMMMSAKDVELSITRLAQKSRAVGIHVILATQRPSTNVITGLIKANLPTRIAFRVASKIDSRVILDANGAEKLLGAGDMLYLPPRSADLLRVQGTFVDDDEIVNVVEEAGRNCRPMYSRELVQKRSKGDQDPSEIDELFDDAARFVLETQRGSASLLQRRYQIGYTRASRLIDLMAAEGLLGDYRGSQAREVLVTVEEFETQRKEALSRRAGKPKAANSDRDEEDDEEDEA